MKKIVVLNGSPRPQGCTSTLAEKVVKAAERQGAEVVIYHLNFLNIKGCQACFRCKQTGRCAIRDDMQPIYDDIAQADGIVLASPVYMWSMSSQLKTAVDRLFAFLLPDRRSALAPGKKILLLFTQGQKDTGMFRRYFELVGENMRFMGFGDYKTLVAGGTHAPEHVTSQQDVLEEAARMGQWLSA